MTIKKVEVYAIRIPLKEPFVVAYDRYDDMPSILTKVETEDGLSGWGEAVPDQHVTGETWESAFQVIQHELAPLIVDQNPFHIDLIHRMMREKICGVPSAKAAIDIALYDLMGKISGRPVYHLIGGKSHPQLHVPQVISIKAPDQMAADAKQIVEAGHRHVKIKVGTDPDLDVERIKAVRSAIPGDVKLRVDANQGWDRIGALNVIERTRDYKVEWYEQPVKADDLLSLAEISQVSHAKIMVDEGVHNSEDLLNVVRLRVADLLNIKLMKSGGIYPALTLAGIAEAAGMPCQVGSMVETAVATMAGAHLSLARSIIRSNELVGPLMFAQDVAPIRYSGDILEVGQKPGLGVDVDEPLVKELTRHYSLIE